MCKHHNIAISAKDIADQLSLFGNLGAVDDLLPSYRVAPTRSIAAIVNADGMHAFEAMKWGGVTNRGRGKSTFKAFNAISEEITHKPFFRGAWAGGQRCLIPAAEFLYGAG
ncbi:hypothetical protein CCAX7_46530 [Capsulimonas corticalis]|uniref:Uncharacterized protein n=1 Tax=Capsulimonas corticalis TaxID=2219043 RepID=A0A402D4X5_9BACT|nr:SOS response-associated peptidase family protein [Capsulimonas corticalis]BDI32602.1 hypothetical protein CCAX7_46530 [Capsulimonas corticalis]